MYIKTTRLCVLISYFGSVYLQEFFLKGELLAGIFFVVGNFPLQELFFWELSPPPPPVISNGPPLIHVIQPIKLRITDDARKQ